MILWFCLRYDSLCRQFFTTELIERCINMTTLYLHFHRGLEFLPKIFWKNACVFVLCSAWSVLVQMINCVSCHNTLLCIFEPCMHSSCAKLWSFLVAHLFAGDLFFLLPLSENCIYQNIFFTLKDILGHRNFSQSRQKFREKEHSDDIIQWARRNINILILIKTLSYYSFVLFVLNLPSEK